MRYHFRTTCSVVCSFFERWLSRYVETIWSLTTATCVTAICHGIGTFTYMLIRRQHAYTLNPITALAYYRLSEDAEQNVLLLVGEGAFLKVYEAKTSRFIAQCRIFNSQIIHGITLQEKHRSSHGLLTIWGGRSFVLLNGSDLQSIISGDVKSVTSYETVASDWLLDCAISPFDDGGSCIFITAHNVALQVSPLVESKRPSVRRLSSPSRSILYSAHIVWTSESSIMVAAGTVFGEIEIVIWNIGLADAAESSEILFTFRGHEGSIFGVQISPEIIDPNGQPTRILASCSDDRTIRLWDLSSLRSHQSSFSVLPHSLVKDTGFGEDASGSQDAISAKRCLATVMGHASRIWQVKFVTPKTIESSKSTLVNVLSFGEDSTVQQWALDGWSKEFAHGQVAIGDEPIPEIPISTPRAALTHIRSFANHTGKHVWSSSLLSTGELSNSLATGGADGAVSIFDVSLQEQKADQESTEMDQVICPDGPPKEHRQARSRIWALDTILEQLPLRASVEELVLQQSSAVAEPENQVVKDTIPLQKKSKKKPAATPKDALSKYALVRPNQLLLTTTFGRVIIQSMDYPHDWLELPLPQGSELGLKSYSIVTGVPDHGAAILAGANGKVYMHCSPGGIDEVADLKRKVAGLFNISRLGDDTIRILATVLGSSQASIISLRPLSSREADIEVIHLPPAFVVTSVGKVSELVILGSRNGQLAVYNLSIGNNPQNIIIDERFRCHDAITSVVEVPPTGEGPSHFVITARDGTYAIFAVSVEENRENTTTVTLELAHRASLPFGPMIEGASFCGTSLMIHGFRSKNFVIWNESEQREVSSVDCGGAHRSYAHCLLPRVYGANYFAYTKASKLHVHEQWRPIHKTLKPGGHGREIKACAVSEDQQFIATAAEDTNIRIWGYDGHNKDPLLSGLQCYTTIRKHSAGIQHLQWATASETSKYLFSGGGYEEFNVWAISDIPGFGLGVVCEASLDDLSEEHDLRIMSFDVVAVGGVVQDDNTSPEKTYMIAIAFSDSTIRAYWYSKSQGFEKLARGRYTSACLTQINVLPLPDGETVVLTASTDGHLALWEFGGDDDGLVDETDAVELAMVERTKVHQSAILSLDILPIGSDGFIVATGGDDNAIALTYLGGKNLELRTVVPSAHAAAVSGLCFSAHSSVDSKGKFRFCTVGGDQKVKHWTVDAVAEEGLGLFKLNELRWQQMGTSDEVATTVADAAGIATFGGHCSHKHFLVYGNGIEVFEV